MRAVRGAVSCPGVVREVRLPVKDRDGCRLFAGPWNCRCFRLSLFLFVAEEKLMEQEAEKCLPCLLCLTVPRYGVDVWRIVIMPVFG